MAAAKPKKPRDGSRPKHGTSIPKGDALLLGVDTDVLREMRKDLSGRRGALIIAAAIKWRVGFGVTKIAKQLLTTPVHGE